MGLKRIFLSAFPIFELKLTFFLIFAEYFRSTGWVWLILSRNSIASFSSGPIVVIHMKCNHRIEHDMQSPFGTSMQTNGDALYRSTKAKITKLNYIHHPLNSTKSTLHTTIKFY